eukprot:SAG31_NODE_5090_length_2748_cov_29.337197_2_plen_94_part_00
MRCYLQAGDLEALREVLYWIDFPMAEFLPELSQDFKRASPIDLFPGGSHCAQRWVTESARPDMGPNLYITPPGGTHFSCRPGPQHDKSRSDLS